MKSLKLIVLAAAFALFGCSGPVPSDMFLTITVSGEGTIVQGSVNGEANEFLSGGEGGALVTSMPLNKYLHEGENEVSFLISRSDDDEDFVPSFRAVLQINIKGEIIDTMAEPERTIFDREMTDEEAAAVAAGETLAFTETFVVNKAKLEAIAAGQ